MINFGQIDEQLFIGSAPQNSVDVARLKQMKISAVLSLQSDPDIRAHRIDWQKLQNAYQYNDLHFQRFPIIDFDEQDLGKRLPQPIRALEQLIGLQHKVYVHCNAGICRAPATVLGYLCHFRDMSIEVALEYIRRQRPHANPYLGAVRLALLELKRS